MLKFDESFLEEMGAANLSEKQRQEFLAAAQDELEIRIGRILCRGKKREEIAQINRLISGSEAEITAWLDDSVPLYRTGKTYKAMQHSGLEGRELLSQTAICLWLDSNCPDFGEICSRCYEELRQELLSYKQQIFPPADKKEPDKRIAVSNV